MISFWQYLTVQIVLIERKTSLITFFHQLLKIMAKKAWLVVSSNIQERFNWEKSRRNKNENNDICLPFYRFFPTKFTVSDLKSKYIFYPNIGSQSFMTNDSEHKFHKTRIENWLSIGFELESPWLGTYIQS